MRVTVYSLSDCCKDAHRARESMRFSGCIWLVKASFGASLLGCRHWVWNQTVGVISLALIPCKKCVVIWTRPGERIKKFGFCQPELYTVLLSNLK